MNTTETISTLPREKTDKISLISLGIIMIFWSSIYSQGIFDVIGQTKGQMALLLAWITSLFFLGINAWRKAINNIKRHTLEISLLGIFILVTAIHLILGNGDLAYVYFVKLLIILVVYLSIIIHLKNDIRSYDKAIIFILIVLTLISIYVVPILFNNPFIARLYEFSDGETPWFGSWGFFMPIAITMPCFISVVLKQKGIFKLLLSLCCVSIGVMIILSTFAASIILLLLGMMGLMFLSVKNKAKLIAITVLVFTALILFVNLYDFSDMPQVGAMVDKIGTIFTYKADLGGDDNDPRIRATLVQVSVHTFVNNPFFGAGLYGARDDGNNIIGLHSGIMDSLAQYGILGMMWYFGFLLIGFWRMIVYLRKEPTMVNKARIITFFLFVIGATGNPVLIESSFVSLVFILAFSPIGMHTLDYVKQKRKTVIKPIYER